MPRRRDVRSILVIGSGPIIIGQACEFDYSGTQAVKALRQHGYRVILVNSNPATIMTDPDLADATYIEPVTADVVARVIEKEQPDALLPTLGGQVALNVTMELHRGGHLKAHDVELIGADIDTIEAAEDRGLFKEVMEAAGLECPRALYVGSLADALTSAESIGYPVMVRPSYALGGGGTGLAATPEDLQRIVSAALAASPVHQVLIEESVAGWKEFELEVMRDSAGNAFVVCSIENLDPMGVHTGDSIAVAPVQTLSDREYQAMRDDALTCMRAVGVETGGSNVQFAVDPATGRRLIIEMNPRVSRSSALASKATGFPIAKIAALVAVGFTLDEITNDITGLTPASFEPALDYVVVKIPRFDFAKFPAATARLATSMRSVGEVMAIGRTFPEALQKGLRSLDQTGAELTTEGHAVDPRESTLEELVSACAVPQPDRVRLIAGALRRGASVDQLADSSRIDPWFIDQIGLVVEERQRLEEEPPSQEAMRGAKRLGFSDRQLAQLWDWTEDDVRVHRQAWGITASFKTVDTCAAEFEASTPYFYSTYEEEDEAPEPGERTVIVLGSGPNRIGQGIEFDYCCVHASMALREAGYSPVMINCNPETVSTDYDTSDRLYFEPLTVEDVLAVVAAEQPEAVIVQFGGQTPLSLAAPLTAAGVRIAGTSPDAIDLAEDRERFSALCEAADVRLPPNGTATSIDEATEVAARIGFPVIVRPSYVLGGRSMRIVHSVGDLTEYLVALCGPEPDRLAAEPLVIDRFLDGATEIDVDALFDGDELYIGGIMEHVEEAGVHSGDSACVIPPPTLTVAAHERIVCYTAAVARALDVKGLVNMQFAVKDDVVYVLEANPRASRTIPFISKATGVPLAKLATRVMMGETVRDLRAAGLLPPPGRSSFVAVKEAVLPWSKFPEEDTVLGPEMRATGETMGIGPSFGTAYAKALEGAGVALPRQGTVFFSLADTDKDAGVETARTFSELGFRLLATRGTASHLARHGVPAAHVDKVGDGPWDPVHLIAEGKIDLVVNTPRGRRAQSDGRLIRQAALAANIACMTTLQGAAAVAQSLRSEGDVVAVASLQEHLASSA